MDMRRIMSVSLGVAVGVGAVAMGLQQRYSDQLAPALKGQLIGSDLGTDGLVASLPYVAINKTVSAPAGAEYVVGEEVTYSITVSLQTDQAGTINISDILPAELTFVSADGAGQYDPSTGLWALSVDAGAINTDFTITAQLNEFACGQSVTNGAVVVNNQFAAELERAVGYSESVIAVSGDGCADPATFRDVEITKTLLGDETTYALGDSISFVITATNLTSRPNPMVCSGYDEDGNQFAFSDCPAFLSAPVADLSISELIPAGLTITDYTIDAEGNSTFDDIGNKWFVGSLDALYNNALVLTEDDVMDNDAQLIVTATATECGTFTNTAALDEVLFEAAGQTDTNPDNNTAAATVTVTGCEVIEPVYEVAVKKEIADAAGTYAAGDTVVYKVTVTNNSTLGEDPQAVNDVIVRDVLPAGVTFVSSTWQIDGAGIGAYDATTGDFTITEMPGAVNGNMAVLTITGTIGDDCGQIDNVAELISYDQFAADAEATNNSAVASVNVTCETGGTTGTETGTDTGIDGPSCADYTSICEQTNTAYDDIKACVEAETSSAEGACEYRDATCDEQTAICETQFTLPVEVRDCVTAHSVDGAACPYTIDSELKSCANYIADCREDYDTEGERAACSNVKVSEVNGNTCVYPTTTVTPTTPVSSSGGAGSTTYEPAAEQTATQIENKLVVDPSVLERDWNWFTERGVQFNRPGQAQFNGGMYRPAMGTPTVVSPFTDLGGYVPTRMAMRDDVYTTKQAQNKQHKKQDKLFEDMQTLPQMGTLDVVYADMFGAENPFDYLVSTHASYTAAVALHADGVLEYTGFHPDVTMTRSEAAYLVGRATGLEAEKEEESAFADVPTESMYAAYVNHAVTQNWMQADTKELFGTHAEVTLGEAYKAVITAFDLGAATHDRAIDIDLIPVSVLAEEDTMPITTGELIQMVYRARVLQQSGESRFYDEITMTLPGESITATLGRTQFDNTAAWAVDVREQPGFHEVLTGPQKGKMILFGHSVNAPGLDETFGAFEEVVFPGDVLTLERDGEVTNYSISARTKVSEDNIEAVRSLAERTDVLVVTCEYDANGEFTERWVLGATAE